MNTHAIKHSPSGHEKFISFSNQLVTVADLHEFRVQLLKDMKQLISNPVAVPRKPWLKSNEVRKLLNISSGTLQTLRSNGTLRYNKVGGIIYYQYEDIQNMMEGTA